MKRIFPVIIILISLSLLGLIYFQAIWLSTAVATKQKQLRENIFVASTEAAESLMQDYNRLLSLNININAQQDGSISIELPRKLLDSKTFL